MDTYSIYLEHGISTYNLNGVSIATLNHNSDKFEALVDMSEQDKDHYYSEMVNHFEMNDSNFLIVG